MGEARNTNGVGESVRKLLLRRMNVDVSDKRRRPIPARELEREASAQAPMSRAKKR